jgi:hypothetical protein
MVKRLEQVESLSAIALLPPPCDLLYLCLLSQPKQADAEPELNLALDHRVMFI